MRIGIEPNSKTLKRKLVIFHRVFVDVAGVDLKFP